MPDQPESWGWGPPEGPEEPGPTPPDGAPGAQRALHPADDFRRTVLFTVAGTILPGLGLIAARKRLAGGIILGLFVAAVAAIAIWAAVDLPSLVALAVRPSALHLISALLVILGLAWVVVVVISHFALRHRPNRAQRVTGGILVGLLAFAVAAPMAVAARDSYDQAKVINKVFKSAKDTRSATRPVLNVPQPSQNGQPAQGGQAGQTASSDPLAGIGRLNVLLLGGDAGKGRVGTRTDTVIVASVDTKTGNTTLFSLPRNTARMPFPSNSPLHKYYPNGFTNGDGQNAEFFLNAIYGNVPKNVPKDVLGPTDDLGADAMKLSVGTALGLKIDYYVLIDLQGFEQLINALGGVTLNVNTYIPIGGNTDLHIKPMDYLHPGKNQHLDGRSALWYARGRYGASDYARMDRQRCVIKAIIDQANPANVLTRYEKIAAAGGDIVHTDMPQEVLPLMVDLSLRVKNGNVRSIVFKSGYDGFVSAHPNFALVRHRVAVAIGETKATASRPGAPKKKKATKTESQNVSDVCAYDPKQAAAAQRPS